MPSTGFTARSRLTVNASFAFAASVTVASDTDKDSAGASTRQVIIVDPPRTPPSTDQYLSRTSSRMRFGSSA